MSIAIAVLRPISIADRRPSAPGDLLAQSTTTEAGVL
jgi:hypothetical protein